MLRLISTLTIDARAFKRFIIPKCLSHLHRTIERC